MSEVHRRKRAENVLSYEETLSQVELQRPKGDIARVLTHAVERRRGRGGRMGVTPGLMYRWNHAH